MRRGLTVLAMPIASVVLGAIFAPPDPLTEVVYAGAIFAAAAGSYIVVLAVKGSL